jgi:hypothetical protein
MRAPSSSIRWYFPIRLRGFGLDHRESVRAGVGGIPADRRQPEAIARLCWRSGKMCRRRATKP